jgi:hypothetical protein
MRKLLLLLLFPILAQAETGLPDSKLTPGALNPNVTLQNMNQTICVPNYTKTIRPSSSYTNKLKKKQIAQYNYIDTDPTHYEEDHLIPLSLGGAPSDPANLWPQPRAGVNGAGKKDILESWAHRQVCKGKLDLGVAQRFFAGNWLSGYDYYIKHK